MIKRGAHTLFHCGDRVYDRRDPRHVGTIRAIMSPYAILSFSRNLDSPSKTWSTSNDHLPCRIRVGR